MGTKTRMNPGTKQKGFLLCVRFSAQEVRAKPRKKKASKAFAPTAGAPKGGDPEGWGPEGWEEATNFAFFPLPPQLSFSLPSLKGLLGTLVVLKRRDPQMCTFGISGCRVNSRNAVFYFVPVLFFLSVCLFFVPFVFFVPTDTKASHQPNKMRSST